MSMSVERSVTSWPACKIMIRSETRSRSVKLWLVIGNEAPRFLRLRILVLGIRSESMSRWLEGSFFPKIFYEVFDVEHLKGLGEGWCDGFDVKITIVGETNRHRARVNEESHATTNSWIRNLTKKVDPAECV